MGAVLTRIDDPRDTLERASRDELFFFAQSRGVSEIEQNMPAILMRKILRQKGLYAINIPNRPLGANPGVLAPDPQEQIPQMNADEALEEQWRQSKTEAKDVSKMGMGELRSECKRRGIKMARTDNLASLRAKLSGETTA